MPRSLSRYREMRDFGVTPEPRGAMRGSGAASAGEDRVFVVQKHEARRLHYDFRLELDGALLSWAVPREPSMSIGVRRLAVRTEDHPREYADFHGDIPEGQYGAGRVHVWDRGTWQPVGDPQEGLARGHLKLDLAGDRLRGRFVLIRMKARGDERQENWLLIRERETKQAAQPAARRRMPRAAPRAARNPSTVAPAAEEIGERASRRRT
jgi:bifunctional non-homologous end joining protein LigD